MHCNVLNTPTVGGWPVGTENLNSGPLNTNSSNGREEDLSPAP